MVAILPQMAPPAPLMPSTVRPLPPDLEALTRAERQAFRAAVSQVAEMAKANCRVRRAHPGPTGENVR